MAGGAALALLAVLAWGQSRPAKCDTCGGKGQVSCAKCEGKWQNAKVAVKCKRERGIGCDGQGHRACFTCKGDGHVACKTCRGSGETVVVTERFGQQLSERRERCRDCAGVRGHPTGGDDVLPRGRVDCEKCRTIWKCSACEKVFEGKTEYCPCSPASQYGHTGKTTLVELRGQIICPRCKGRGEYEQKGGKCPYCKEGRVRCPDCDGQGR